ncbi:MAG: DUF6431 domain-containing protein, partial [Clostridiales bacterium]|nr:DUF6431 domain-containing protein [Clostridiales bacterium]
MCRSINSLKRTRLIFVQSPEASVCPICGGGLVKRGLVPRGVIMPDGVRRVFLVRRYSCRDCNKSHRELPDFMTPYKCHCTETIENIITGSGGAAPCEDNT